MYRLSFEQENALTKAAQHSANAKVLMWMV